MTHMTRRSFVAGSLTLTAASARRVHGANERIGAAVVGVNGMGSFHVKTLIARADVRVVALCDVDRDVVTRVAKTAKDAGRTDPGLIEDFRKVLDDKAVDAIIVATPHHW